MKRRIIFLTLIPILLGILLFGILSRHKTPDFIQMQRAELPATVSHEQVNDLKALGYVSGQENEKPTSGAPSPVIRKIIRNGEVIIRVQSIHAFLRTLEEYTKSGDGYIAAVDSTNESATVTLRMPAQALNTTVWWLKEHGDVLTEKLQSDDISEQYYDLKSRLENQRRFEARLLEMVRTNTGSLSDLIQVEEKLNQVREQIETFEGKLRMYDNLTALATLKLQIIPEAAPLPTPPGFMRKLKTAWTSSQQLLAGFLEFCGIATTALLPWVLLVLPLALVARYVRRLRQRRPAPNA